MIFLGLGAMSRVKYDSRAKIRIHTSGYPTGRIHTILDNYSIHQSRAVQERLARASKGKALLPALLQATAQPCREDMVAFEGCSHS